MQCRKKWYVLLWRGVISPKGNSSGDLADLSRHAQMRPARLLAQGAEIDGENGNGDQKRAPTPDSNATRKRNRNGSCHLEA
jgi:hypothetical protein